ncbi:hypothetical protein NSTCB13_00066 [Nostoc sp. DSM 114160]|jgi:hypothetical protein
MPWKKELALVRLLSRKCTGTDGNRCCSQYRNGAFCQLRHRSLYGCASSDASFYGAGEVIKFEGCYHGHADMFLVKAGSGIATLGLPDSPGVPKSVTSNTLTAPFNDLEAVRVLFEQNPDEIAGVIVEPVVGNAGFIHLLRVFLKVAKTDAGVWSAAGI